MINKPSTYLKAIVAAVVAAGSYAIPVVDDGLTPSEVLGIVVAALIALGAVFGVKNAPAE